MFRRIAVICTVVTLVISLAGVAFEVRSSSDLISRSLIPAAQFVISIDFVV